MIDKKAANYANSFHQSCLARTKFYPAYTLDLTWPNFGILDLFLSPLRGKQEFSEQDFELINGAAAFMGGLIRDSWLNFEDKLDVRVTTRPKQEEKEGSLDNILLSVQGGKYLENNKKFTIPLTALLIKVLQDPLDPFPFFEKIARPLSSGQNLMSPLATGLMTGLCPYGDGKWKEYSAQDFVDYLAVSQQHLACSAASYYKRIFPKEELGATPELYAAGLVLPPMGFHEPFPAMYGVQEVLKYLENTAASKQDIQTLMLNLAGNPDELISSIGFCIAAGLLLESPPPKLIAIGKAKGSLTPALRPAYLEARTHFGLVDNWLQVFESGDIVRAQQMATQEKRLGFLPHLSCPLEFFTGETGKAALHNLAWHRLEEASLFVKAKLLEEKEPNLLLQDIELDIALRRFKNAKLSLLQMRDEELLPQGVLYKKELLGLLFLETGKIKDAEKIFQELLQEKPADKEVRVRLGNHYALSLYLNYEFEKALEEVNSILAHNPSSVDAKLIASKTLRALGQEEDAERELKELSQFAGMDRRVFSELFLRPLSE